MCFSCSLILIIFYLNCIFRMFPKLLLHQNKQRTLFFEIMFGTGVFLLLLDFPIPDNFEWPTHSIVPNCATFYWPCHPYRTGLSDEAECPWLTGPRLGSTASRRGRYQMKTLLGFSRSLDLLLFLSQQTLFLGKSRVNGEVNPGNRAEKPWKDGR